MKIRTDFVTNSSSSCFVVAYKNKKIDALTEAQNPTLKLLNDAIGWFVESDAHYETGEGYEATNETELVEAIGQKKEVTQKYPEVSIIDKLVNAFFGSEGEYGETCAGKIVKTITELHNYFEFEYGKDFAEDKYVLNLYNESKQYVTNGYTVVFKSIDYNDSASRDMLYDLSENLGSKFIILEDD